MERRWKGNVKGDVKRNVKRNVKGDVKRDGKGIVIRIKRGTGRRNWETEPGSRTGNGTGRGDRERDQGEVTRREDERWLRQERRP